jgi:hypothetical protein
MIQFSLEASGQFTLQLKSVNFAEVVEYALKQAIIKAANRPVTLDIEIEMVGGFLPLTIFID